MGPFVAEGQGTFTVERTSFLCGGFTTSRFLPFPQPRTDCLTESSEVQ